MRVRSLGRKDLLEEGMATHSSIFAWRIPRTKEPRGLQSTRSQRVGQGRVTEQQQNYKHQDRIKETYVVMTTYIRPTKDCIKLKHCTKLKRLC